MNPQEHIRKVLKEETSLQKNLMGLFKDRGIKVATAAVGAQLVTQWALQGAR